jgi:hypothetical protein
MMAVSNGKIVKMMNGVCAVYDYAVTNVSAARTLQSQVEGTPSR